MEMLLAGSTAFMLLWLGCAVFCWVIANSRGRFAGAWFLLGLVFGIFALIAISALPSKEKDKNEPTPATHVKCPECREFVLKDASRCKHCGVKLLPQ